MHVLGQIVGHGQLLGGLVDLVVAQADKFADLLVHGAHVAHGLNHVAGAGLALGANHGCTLGDAAQRLAQVLRAAHKRHIELVLVDVVHVVGRGKHLGFVDVIDFDGLQNAGLGDVSDTHLGHNRNGHGFLDALDHGRVAHAGNAAGGTDVGGDALERHHRAGTSVLSDLRLLGRGDVHDHAALEHLGQITVEFRTILRHEFPFVRRCLVSRFIIERSGLAPPKPVQFGWGQFATSAPIQSNLHMFISPIWHVIPDCQSITGQEEKSWHACDYLLFASSASPEMPSTYSRMSPGWQSNAAQMAARAEKRMAETRLFLILERFTLVMPT